MLKEKLECEKEEKELAEKLEKDFQTIKEKQWSAGDSLINYSGDLKAFCKKYNLPYWACLIYRRTSLIFPEMKRFISLTWSHHFLASRTNKPDDWLKEAETNGWSTWELRKIIRGVKQAKIIERLKIIGKQILELSPEDINKLETSKKILLEIADKLNPPLRDEIDKIISKTHMIISVYEHKEVMNK